MMAKAAKKIPKTLTSQDIEATSILMQLESFILMYFGDRKHRCIGSDCPICAMWDVHDSLKDLTDVG